MQGRSSSDHPNSNIVFFSLGLSLPFCVAQIFCAVYTQIFDLDYTKILLSSFFATFDARETGFCQIEVSSADAQSDIPVYGTSANCYFCVFPLLSTLISAGFCSAFLLVAWRVTERIISAVINKTLVFRIRLLQLLVAFLLPVSIACRGVTVLFQPFDLGFEILRLVNVSYGPDRHILPNT
jgi:hypothetical protein